MEKGFKEVILGDKKYLLVLGSFIKRVKNAAQYELIYVIDRIDSAIDSTGIAELLKIPEGRITMVKTRDLCQNALEGFERVADKLAKRFLTNWKDLAYRQSYVGFAREASRYTGLVVGGIVYGD